MDFLSMILEHILDLAAQKFNFIQNPIIKCVAQIIVMLAICAVVAGVFCLIAYIISRTKGNR